MQACTHTDMCKLMLRLQINKYINTYFLAALNKKEKNVFYRVMQQRNFLRLQCCYCISILQNSGSPYLKFHREANMKIKFQISMITKINKKADLTISVFA